MKSGKNTTDLTIDMLDTYLQEFTDYEQTALAHYQAHHRFLLPEETPENLMHAFVLRPTDIRNVNREAFLNAELYHRIVLDNTKTFLEYEYFFRNCDIYIHKQPRYTSSPMQSHLFFEICYQYTGESTFRFQGEKKETVSTLHQGDFFFLAPNQMHAVTVSTDSLLLNIGVRQSTFEEAFSHNIPADSVLGTFFSAFLNPQYSQHYIYFQTTKDPSIRSLIQDLMLTYCTPSLYSRNIMNIRLSLLCLTLLQNYNYNAKIACGGKIPVKLSDIMYYIENNYASISVQDIAKKFGYSGDYLNLLFKKTTSHNLGETLLNLKMQKAASYLADTDLSVSTISECLGYNNPSNLIRSFKKYYGITPSQYRKKSM